MILFYQDHFSGLDVSLCPDCIIIDAGEINPNRTNKSPCTRTSPVYGHFFLDIALNFIYNCNIIFIPIILCNIYFTLMKKTLIDIFLDLVAIEGLSGREKLVADYIRQFCAQYDVTIEEDNTHKLFGGNSGNLICRVGNGGDIALLSHMDTARSTKGVRPLVKADRITSDGTTVLGVDNRVGIAVTLYTLARVFDELKSPPGFTVAFTICEETTMIGSKHIDLGAINMAVIFDSALRPGNFICQSYGSQRFDITVTGKAAHSGLAPEHGINAIKTAATAIN